MRHIRLIRHIKKLGKKALVGLVTLILVILPVTLLILFNAKGVSAAWFDDNWGYRKSIPITAHTAEETNKYITITLSSLNSTVTSTLVTNGQLQSDCGDLRFTKQNGELLPYYIVSGCNSASTVIQVNFDVFPALSQTIYMYYGNPTVANGFNAAAFSTEAANYTVGTGFGSEEKATTPIGYWKFDDGTGTTAKDSTSQAKNATLVNSPTWQTEDMCVSGKCVQLGASNDYIEAGSNSDYVFQNGDVWTTTMWVKTSTSVTGVNGGVTLLSKGTGGAVAGYAVGIGQLNSSGQDNKIGFVIDAAPGNNYMESTSSLPDVNDGKWHYVALVFDAANNSNVGARIYFDGVDYGYVNSRVARSGWATTSSYKLTMGSVSSGPGTTQNYTGFIDDTRVYRYALSADQIKANYNAAGNPDGVAEKVGTPVNNQPSALNNGMVGYWKMDESSGNATDSSGNSRTLTNNNTSTYTGGKYGNAGTFNGTNQYFSSSASWDDPKTTYTWSAWFKPTSTLNSSMSPAFQAIMGGFIDANNRDQLYYQKSNGSLEFSMCVASVCTTPLSYVSTYTAATWYHVAVTRDSSNNWKMYVNGASVATGSNSTASTSGNRTTYIGQEGALSYFGGSIDESRIYNRALSPAEVTQLYNFAPGPVLYYPFDDGTGSSAADRSGNGYTGTFAGSPTWATGKFGKAVNLTGNSNDYVDVNQSLAQKSFTVSGWFKAGTDVSNYRMLIAKETPTGAPWNYRVLIEQSTGYLHGGINDGSNGAGVTTTTAYNDNIWHYFTFTRDVDADKVYLYVDGVLKGSATDTTTGAEQNSQEVWIGRSAYSSAYPYIGSLDEIKIYSYARTPQQITQDMNANHPAPGSPVGSPLGYWKFDEGALNRCTGGSNDACNSGNGGTSLDGTFNGDAAYTQVGKFSRAVALDGTGDYVLISDFFNQESGSYSMSAWVKPTSTLTTASSTVSFMDKTAAGSNYEFAYINNRGLCFYTWTGSADRFVCYSTSLTGGTWYHIAVTHDQSTAYVYLNGIQVATGSIGIVANAVSFQIGRRAVADQYFTGSIDEAKVYNSMLTADQIKLDMNRGSAQVLGALSDSSSYQVNAANQEYCVPGAGATCTAPVAIWDFETGTGTSSFDTSGNSYTGTLTNGPTWAVGKIGKAVNFDGSNDFIAHSSSTATISGDVTVTAWIYPTAGTGAYRGIVAKRGTGCVGAGNIEYQLYLHTNDGALGFHDNTNQNKSTYVPTLNTWTHIAGVVSGTTYYLYANGRQVATGSFSVPNGENCTLQIGASETNASEPYAGKIDNVRIYNYARSASQVAWDYNKGAPVGHWKMDECQGTRAGDSSGNGYSGTITIGGSGTYTTPGTCTASSASSAWYNGRTGKFNYALAFDGTDDYVDMGNNLNPGTGDFSVSGWVYKTDTSDLYVANKVNGVTTLGWFLRVNYQSDGKLYFLATDANGGTGTTQGYSSGSVASSTWTHVAATFKRSDNTIILYINGVPQTTTYLDRTLTVTTNINTSNSFWLGSHSGGAYGKGTLDEVKYYNFVLTAEQIKRDMNQGGVVRYGPTTGAP